MKVYTRTGDAGQTALFGGERVPKSHARVAAYGALDEGNALLGWVMATELPQAVADALPGIMSDLFDLGAEMATPPGKSSEKLENRLENAVDGQRIAQLEAWIDQAEASLEPLTTFVLPTGNEGAARLHMARTVLRRAERAAVGFHTQVEPLRPELLAYLNRLSDLLFVWSRLANHEAGQADMPWRAKKAR